MIMQDKLEKERNDAKNNVEEYVYDMRDKLHGVLEKFVNEAVSTDEILTLHRVTNAPLLCEYVSQTYAYYAESMLRL